MFVLPLLNPLRGRGASLALSSRGVASGWPSSRPLLSSLVSPSSSNSVRLLSTSSTLLQRNLPSRNALRRADGVTTHGLGSLSPTTSRRLSSEAIAKDLKAAATGDGIKAAEAIAAAPPPVPSPPPAFPLSLLVSSYPRAAPYLALARLDKPIGTWLLYLPCAFSLTLSAQLAHLPPTTLLWNLALFGTGALVMRGAGCTINDLWDRDLDKSVERTKGRPLASGDLTIRQALVFLGGQLTAGLGVLVCLNKESIFLGAASLIVVGVYPLMKRITYWPQLVLGLAFNWGALLGPMALTATLQPTLSLPLYIGCISWTLLYDTIYAHQDKLDDVGAGIKSTALLFGERTKTFLAGFGTTFVASTLVAASDVCRSMSVSSALNELAVHHPGLSLASVAASGHIAWQIFSLDQDDRASCWAKFCANRHLGYMLWGGMTLDYLWAWAGGFV